MRERPDQHHAELQKPKKQRADDDLFRDKEGIHHFTSLAPRHRKGHASIAVEPMSFWSCDLNLGEVGPGEGGQPRNCDRQSHVTTPRGSDNDSIEFAGGFGVCHAVRCKIERFREAV